MRIIFWFLLLLKFFICAPIIVEPEATAVTTEFVQANRIVEPSEFHRAIDDSHLDPFSNYNGLLCFYVCQLPFCYLPYFTYLWCKPMLCEVCAERRTVHAPIRVAEVIN